MLTQFQTRLPDLFKNETALTKRNLAAAMLEFSCRFANYRRLISIINLLEMLAINAVAIDLLVDGVVVFRREFLRSCG